MLVHGNSLPFSLHTPFLSNQAKPIKWWCGGGRTPKSSSSSQRRKCKLHLKTRASEGGILQQVFLYSNYVKTRRSSTLKYPHISSFKNITSLFQRKIKDPPNPFQKNPIIIITIIKNPIRNHKEALRVWVLHSSSMLFGSCFKWWLYTYLKKKP